jgi:sugar lactone lactonase YvrE
LEIINGISGILLESLRYSKECGLFSLVDIEEGKLFFFHEESKISVRQFDFKIGCANLVADDCFILGTSKGIYYYYYHSDILTRVYLLPETGFRFNDGIIDPWGDLIIGSMGYPNIIDQGAKLYHYNLKNIKQFSKPTIILDNVSISNGIAISSDNSGFFFVDTSTKKLKHIKYDFNERRILSQSDFISFHERAYPDGIYLDSFGRLWVAEWGGGCVSCWSERSGEFLCEFRVGDSLVTSCLIVNDVLYITTAFDKSTNSKGKLLKLTI